YYFIIDFCIILGVIHYIRDSKTSQSGNVYFMSILYSNVYNKMQNFNQCLDLEIFPSNGELTYRTTLVSVPLFCTFYNAMVQKLKNLWVWFKLNNLQFYTIIKFKKRV